MNQTVELVKANAQRVELVENSHSSRLRQSLPQYDGAIGGYRYAQNGFIKHLKSLGFHYFVDDKFALKFKYHAEVLSCSPCVGKFSRLEMYTHCEKKYLYVGDIPDSVLDKIDLIKNGIMPSFCFTVHSNQPLPLIRCIPTDPVLIVWGHYVQFDDTWWGWRSWRPSVGAVVAVWDTEKELSIW